jgi:hypothetical protein
MAASGEDHRTPTHCYTIAFNITMAEATDLKALAKQRRCSMAGLVRGLIRKELKRTRGEPDE